ncbi:MAG TPA: glycosyltransferase family 8 protein [Devosiaceae bacterium]|nr:glycosyltransferase family 8 protein [Devosiaceae bacterium]
MSAASLHVALTFDDNYWAPAFAVMRSTCLATRRPADLTFHLIHIGLMPAHRAEFDAIAAEFPATIRHIDLAAEPAYRELIADLPIGRPFTPVIYARLLLDRLLPQDIERVLYLDSDTFVRAPVEDLLGLDLEGKAIGAVLDPHRHIHMFRRDLKSNREVYGYNFSYFNSGVLLIDREAFAAADLPNVARRMQRSGELEKLQYDQALLNLAFKDNWLPLDFRWNLIGPEPAHEVLEPFILHYTGPRKPWTPLPGAAFGRIYRHVMTNRNFDAFQRQRLRQALRRPFARLFGKP